MTKWRTLGFHADSAISAPGRAALRLAGWTPARMESSESRCSEGFDARKVEDKAYGPWACVPPWEFASMSMCELTGATWPPRQNSSRPKGVSPWVSGPHKSAGAVGWPDSCASACALPGAELGGESSRPWHNERRTNG